MPTGDPSDNGSESLTDQPGQAHDAGVTPSPAPTLAGSTPPPAPGNTAPPAASGAPAPATPDAASAPDDDPVQDAIKRLARPTTGEQPRDDQGRFTAAERAAAEIAKAAGKPAAKPAAAATPKPAVAKPDAPVAPAPTAKGVETDPYHGFDEREQAALKGKTRQRIEELHQRATAAAARTAELEKAVAEPQPDELSALTTEHKLENDVGFVAPAALAALVRTEAAVTRSMIALRQGRSPSPADVQVAGKFFERMDAMRGHLGLAQPARAQAPEIQPFKGELPEGAKDLVEVYGLPEADVRLMLAIKARQAGGASTNPPPAAPAPQQAPPMTAAAPMRGTGVDMEALYGQRIVADLARDGVAPEMVQAHYQVILPIAAKLTQEQFPTVPAERIAAVFDALPPDRRYDILQKAHREFRAKSKSPVRSSPTPPPPATPPAFGGGAPRRTAPAANGDPVAAAIAVLARPQE